MIQAEDETWKSVCKADHFFKNVKVIESLDEFIELIQKDRVLNNTHFLKLNINTFK